MEFWLVALYLLIFVFGVVWGSFLNVVIYRSANGTSPLSGRSMCPKCKKLIPWKYNIPILSFFLLRGRCAYCKKRISWQYPVVEFVTGLMFLWWFVMGSTFFHLVGSPWFLVQRGFWLLVGMIFTVIFVIDLRYMIIPESLNLMLFCASLFYRVGLVSVGVMQEKDLYYALLSGLGLALFFYLTNKLTLKIRKMEGFGGGDMLLAPSLGLIVGWPRIVVALYFAFIAGAIVSLYLLVTRKKKMKGYLPFGPFLIAGTLFALVWGDYIWRMFWGII